MSKKYVAVEVSVAATAVRGIPPGVRSTPPDWMSTVPLGEAEPVFPVTVIDRLMRAVGEVVELLAVAVVVVGSRVAGAVTVRLEGVVLVPLL